MSGDKLRAQCVSNASQTVLVTCYEKNNLMPVGHAFATTWETSVGKHVDLLSSDLTNITFEGTIGWVTQLVVDMGFRRHRIATQLLQTLKTDELFANVTAMGIASSHPASCTALATYASKS